ncbi:hypothetical protein B6A42_07305 [Vibrio coralliilyticus]|nr:hypothetical protein B6A42_07305 [Vibrio coralliilyticus]
METFLVFLALMVASATLYVQRIHNRKQVLPIIHLYEQYHDEDESREVEMRLHNDGLGPAIINKVTLEISGVVHEIEAWHELNKLLEESFPYIKIVDISLPYCLKAHGDEILYKLEVPFEHWEQFRGTKMDVCIKVHSVYEDVAITTFDGTTYTSNKHDQVFETAFDKAISVVKRWKN